MDYLELLAIITAFVCYGYISGKNKAILLILGKKKQLHSSFHEHGLFVALNIIQYNILFFSFIAIICVSFDFDIISSGFLSLTSIAISGIALYKSEKRIKPRFVAKKYIERFVKQVLFVAAFTAILITGGILLSIVVEAISFFQLESFFYFLTGSQWSPSAPMLETENGMVSTAKFGALALFSGTMMITFIAMLVALIIGVLSAIYLAEYAPNRLRNKVKPIIEILAGIPTVVYGFFASITVAPFIVQLGEYMGLEVSFNSALASGIVMGIMIVPIVSSLSEDILKSIPSNIKEGALALGITLPEAILHILLPTAMPGIIAACLLGFSRAIGETMIVVMAAGLRPNLTWNPLEDMTTVTVRIVDALTGDQAFDSPATLSAFALALTLFFLTLLINMLSVFLIRKFKRKYKVSSL